MCTYLAQVYLSTHKTASEVNPIASHWRFTMPTAAYTNKQEDPFHVQSCS